MKCLSGAMLWVCVMATKSLSVMAEVNVKLLNWKRGEVEKVHISVNLS